MKNLANFTPPYKYKGFGVFTTLLTLGSVLGMMGVAEGAGVGVKVAYLS